MIGALALGLCAAGVEAAPPIYRITVVPPPVGHAGCQVNALNDVGQATGTCGLAGFVWSQAGGAQSISDPLFPAAALYPQAINNAGVVTGSAFETTRNPGFIWDAVNGLTYYNGKGRWNDPRSINDSSQVVGSSALKDPTFAWKAFRWSPAGQVEVLRPSRNRRTLANDINNHGQIAGTYEKLEGGITHAVRFEANGEATPLLRGKRSSVAYALNDLGHVAGGMETHQRGYHAFVWTPEAGALDIDPRTRRRDESYASDINGAGQVVGKMSWLGAGGNTYEAAFYWDAVNGMVDLFTLLDPDDPLSAELSEFLPDASVKINAQGQITVNGYGPNVGLLPLLLTPVP